MTFLSLRPYLEALSKKGLLVEIDEPVDPHLELAEIHRRVIAANGPTLLFRNVKGKNFPVVTNLFGSEERVKLAFGPEPQEFIREIARAPIDLLPPTLGKIWGKRNFIKKLIQVGFKETSSSPVFACEIPGASVKELPAITSWIEDGGRFITLPLVHTKSVVGHSENLGMYRMQLFEDQNETGMHFQIGKGGGFHLHEAEEKGLPLPANVYLGGPPALILSAITPLPEEISELLLTSLILGQKLKRGKHAQIAINPIAEAEFCLSGFIPAQVRRLEGPFGDHYGYYSLCHDYPVFRPTKIFHRKGAIYPATVVGKPRQEDFYLGDYLQELLSPMFPLVMPGIKDLWSYGETGYHALSAVILKERYEREALRNVFRILGEGQLSLTKFLLVLDDTSISLKSFKKVLTHILERVDWRKDLYIFGSTSMDSLDYCGPVINKGSKGVILGLGKKIRDLPSTITIETTLPSFIKKIACYTTGCLVVEVDDYSKNKECVEILAKQEIFKAWPLIVAVDQLAFAIASDTAFLWTTFTRFDPASDIYAFSSRIVKNRIEYEGPIVIDARMKPWYPKELFCDPATEALVSKKWKNYFPKGGVEMGSSAYANLT